VRLKGKTVLLGVSGGIAAYKTPELVRALVKQGARVHVVMSANASQFVAPLSLQVVAKNPVLIDVFDRKGRAEVKHIALADSADLAILAPATANVIGKLAHGIADDALTTVFLAVRCPTLVAPAMNAHMWEHPAVQESVASLRKWGYRFEGPDEGFLAEGYSGVGRMSEPAAIAAAAGKLPSKGLVRSRGIREDRRGKLAGVRVLVNAGPTREYLDAVRFLSNPSSGKLGYAVAAEAAARGAKVTLVSGPTDIEPPAGVDVVRVTSADEMLAACRKAFRGASIFVASAAVSDFKPKTRARGKVKKEDAALGIELARTPDVLKTLAADKGRRFVVGFAAETDDVLRHAKGKLRRKNLDLIVANDVGKPGRGFGGDDNLVHLIGRTGKTVDAGPAPKAEVAAAIWDEILRRWKPARR
jgi:phosphopantothenoylcysteine decarboxylase/phosphopantothenate--cysteine ligase